MSNLHIDSVTKSFGGFNLLTDIFFNCEIGQIKGLVGKNGSGKTTLLKIIFGTVPATNKFVKVGDKLIKNLADGRGLINYLPQDNFLPNNIKVEVLIRLFLDKENASILMANEFVIPLLNKKNEQLSGGEKRIIEILLIVHSKAKFILLDEPFNGVSPKVRDYIVRYIQSNKSTKGFLITDHDFESIFHLSDKILYLENGFLREIDNLQELVEHGYLTKTIFDNLK